MTARRIKLAGRRALGSEIWLGVVHRAESIQYLSGRRGRVWNPLYDRLLKYEFGSAADRKPSIDGLVELFFELATCARVDRFVEVGAKEAAASARARRIGIDEVVAFEANPYTHRRFAADAEAAGVVYEHLVAADVAGSVTINVRLHADGTPIADGQASLHLRHNNPAGHTQVEVAAVRLDDYFGASTGRRTAMWIDVEGASAVVLRGATRLLDEVDVLMIEVEEIPLWDGQEWTRADVVEFLGGHGLVPVARDRQSRMQFNVVFVRGDRLADLDVTDSVRRHMVR